MKTWAIADEVENAKGGELKIVKSSAKISARDRASSSERRAKSY